MPSVNSLLALSRRTFLKGVAATVAMPYAVSSRALGADLKPSPSNRLTMGFIGIGGMGGGQLGAFLGSDKVQVLAVCEVSKSTLEAGRAQVEQRYAQESKAGTYKGCTAYNNFQELLARDDIDAVLIATPDHWHALIAIEAARAGKDIY